MLDKASPSNKLRDNKTAWLSAFTLEAVVKSKPQAQ
ncbi:hypothetical protein swp_1010 [Shewanella piezotolerans WP3]|uniref:Uncharacterized protein n=1 Tax=Shewanella piezotolerans (strain WP3 / JCM 13877) TaxID=225849 RepID=B8CJ52_SHEPW|nr:hypothetical protein swp_1010 [Shewanella piezotolerans WP3]